MTATALTILIGDEIATGLDKALRALPGTLPLWTVALPGWPITPMIAEGAVKAIDKIKADWKAGGGSPLPVNIIVSAGRSEVLGEPDEASKKDLAEFADDVKSVAKTLQGAGNVFWILPPAVSDERKARSIMAKTLQDAGIRILDASQYVSDTKASRDDPQPPDLPADAYDTIAKALKLWVPIGPSPLANMVLTFPGSSTSDSVASKAKSAVSAAVDSVSAWPAPAKIVGGLFAATVIVGGAYAVSRTGKKKGREP